VSSKAKLLCSTKNKKFSSASVGVFFVNFFAGNFFEKNFGGDFMENVKIFNAKGEYTMSEDETFKTAKTIALDSALKNLDDDVKNFLHDSFKNLDDDDIAKIAEKFLTKNKPRFVRENLTNGDMICYAEIQTEINLIDLNNFVENFDVFKLEKKVDKMQKTIDELSNKFELFQKFLSQVIEAEINVKNNPKSSYAYCKRGLAYYNLQNYTQAIEDYTQAINLKPNYKVAYKLRGDAYKALGENEKAEADFAKARELGYEG